MKTTFTRSIESAMNFPLLFVLMALLVGCELSEPIQESSETGTPLISLTLLSEPPAIDWETENFYILSPYSTGYWLMFDEGPGAGPQILQNLLDAGYSVEEGWHWRYEMCLEDGKEIAPMFEFVVRTTAPYQGLSTGDSREGSTYWSDYSIVYQHYSLGQRCDDGGIIYHYTINHPSK